MANAIGLALGDQLAFFELRFAVDQLGLRLSFGVEMVETLGADSYAYGAAVAGGNPLIARLGATLPAVGDALSLTFAAQHMHWFDAGNGRRLA